MPAHHPSSSPRSRKARLILFVACLFALCTGCAQPAPPIAATPVNNQSSAPGPQQRVTGVASCTSSGCHGKPFSGIHRDWQTAYHVWASEDPHRHAFEVLYTERSIEICRNLNPDLRPGQLSVDERAFHHLLQERCIGCHATGAQSKGLVASADILAAWDAFQSGVSCESCHGPANAWIDKHYLASWPSPDVPAKASERRAKADDGFYATSNLSIRGAVCTGCHVGPMISEGGTLYDVNHDLIAAGHPRLTFELDAYLSNLPKHWNEKEDGDRYPGAFHVNAWAAGQEQSARRLTRQIEVRQNHKGADQKQLPWPDFANFECFDCHHALRPPRDSRTVAPRPEGQRGLPRPALLPLAELAAIHAESNSDLSKYSSVLSDSWSAVPAAAETEPIPAYDVAKSPKLATFSRADLPALAEALAASIRSPATWDEAVQFYLAAQAFARDWNSSPLKAAADALADNLGPMNFSGKPPTQYDSPADYDPAKLHTALENLTAALKAAAQAQRQTSP